MGHASNPQNVFLCLSAMDSVLTKMGAPIASGVAVTRAKESYANADQVPVGALFPLESLPIPKSDP